MLLSAHLQDLMQDKQIAAVIISDNAKSHAPRTPNDLRTKFQRTLSAPLSPVHGMKRKPRGGRRGGLVRTLSESNVFRAGKAACRWDSEPLEAASSVDLPKNHRNGSSTRTTQNDSSISSTSRSLFENVKKPSRRGSSVDTKSALIIMEEKPKEDNSSLKQNVHKPVRCGLFEANTKKVLSPNSSSTFSCSLIHNVSKPVRRRSKEGRGGGGTQQHLPLSLLVGADNDSSCSTMMSAANLITLALNDMSLNDDDDSLVEYGVANREASRTALSAST